MRYDEMNPSSKSAIPTRTQQKLTEKASERLFPLYFVPWTKHKMPFTSAVKRIQAQFRTQQGE